MLLKKFRLKLLLKLLSFEIEWRWKIIMKDRKKQNLLLDNGITFDNDKFLRVNSSLDHHCNKVMRLTCKFNELVRID